MPFLSALEQTPFLAYKELSEQKAGLDMLTST